MHELPVFTLSITTKSDKFVSGNEAVLTGYRYYMPVEINAEENSNETAKLLKGQRSSLWIHIP